MTMMGEDTLFGKLAAGITSLMFLYTMIERFCPFEIKFDKYFSKFKSMFKKVIHIKFYEYTGQTYRDIARSKTYASIEKYLIEISSTQARKLRADMVTENGSGMILSMDDYDEIKDEFQGIKLKWSSSITVPNSKTGESRRYYKLSFNRKDRDLITKFYLSHVLKEAKVIAAKTRSKKLYTNEGSSWCHVTFDHPASFDTLAMSNSKKEEIIKDLVTFCKDKAFYERTGRTWKRGYLLYGPPGTGKSSMIASMAHLLDYDIYDLELTAVEDNTELRQLLIETTSKSIIVIEDIDCSLDLTAERDKGAKPKPKPDENDDKKEKDRRSKITLSGLLNFIDGLWSAIGSERIIVFTTNHKDKLDPALIRPGRMDKHIELSFCCYEAFKVLAKNYLNIDSHDLFATVGKLLEETKTTPAEVAENLTYLKDDPDKCLANLIKVLEKSKEQARLKVEKGEGDEKKEDGDKKEENEDEKEENKDEKDENEDEKEEDEDGSSKEEDRSQLADEVHSGYVFRKIIDDEFVTFEFKL